VIGRAKRRIMKMFRELLVYHGDSLRFRAKILTLAITSDNQDYSCKFQMLEKIAKITYPYDYNRAQLLVETVKEYIDKIEDRNGLNFEHLILSIEKEVKESKRFTQKIDLTLLELFQSCIQNKGDLAFFKKVLHFLEQLKIGT